MLNINKPVNSDLIHQFFHHLDQQNNELSKVKSRCVQTTSFNQNEGSRAGAHWSHLLFKSAIPVSINNNKLVVTRDRKILCEFEISSSQSEVFLGSHSKADINIDGAQVDPLHAKVSCQNGRYQIEDLGSKRGCFLNGKKLYPHVAVDFQNGDILRIMAFQVYLQTNEKQGFALEKNKSKPSNNAVKFPLKGKSMIVKPNELTKESIDIAEKSNIINPWHKNGVDLIVTDIINENETVKTFRLVSKNALLFSYLPGQFVTLILDINGQQVQRSYSMSSSASRPHTLDLTVKRVPGGLVSNWLCDHVKMGDALKVKRPVGRFSVMKSSNKKLLFIGAGSGITPLMSMTRWLFDTVSNTDTKVLFSFKNYDDVIFRKELDCINESSNKIDVSLALTRQNKRSIRKTDFSGRINAQLLRSFVEDLQDRDIFLCGPEEFMTNVKNILHDLNYPMQQLHLESYAGSVTPEIKSNAKPKLSNPLIDKKNNKQDVHSVHFSKSNKTIMVDEKTSLLELAESDGLDIDYSCKSGACGECMVKCLSGQVMMDEECDIDEHERKQGLIFSCASYARSDLVIDI